MAQPFFSMILSLSSHEPFQVPMKTEFPGDDFPSKFKNCCFYTDKSIGEYLQLVSKEPWYQNTLFIFVADHGHILPRNRRPDEQARFHIPIIFYGNVLKPEYKGATISNVGMQGDLPATILSQLNLPHTQFRWSNDLLNFYRNNFAYYSFDTGIGFVKDEGGMHLNFSEGKVTSSENYPRQDTVLGKAFLQELYDQYLSF
jgi:phosphoglycerol transferase MdoB-like AlkP superfamily enzyme